MADVSKIQLPSGTSVNIKDKISGYVTASEAAAAAPVQSVNGQTGTVTTTDTKNTAGSTNTTSKIYLIGSLEQGASPQTYSNSGLYFSNGLRSSASSSDNFSEISQGSTLIKFSVNDEDANYTHEITLNGTGSKFGIVDSSIVTSGVFVSDNDGKTYIYNVATPTNSTDAANKSYVDTRIINPATKTSGQFLMYNGTSWVAQSLPIYDGTVVTS